MTKHEATRGPIPGFPNKVKHQEFTLMPKAKTAKKSQPITNGSPDTTSITAFEPPASSRSNLEERIRQRAYEFFLERGGLDGYAEEDWLRAEAEVLGHSGRRTA